MQQSQFNIIDAYKYTNKSRAVDRLSSWYTGERVPAESGQEVGRHGRHGRDPEELLPPQEPHHAEEQAGGLTELKKSEDYRAKKNNED